MKISKRFLNISLITIAISILTYFGITWVARCDYRIYQVIQNMKINHYRPMKVGEMKIFKPNDWLITYLRTNKTEYKFQDLIWFPKIQDEIEKINVSIIDKCKNSSMLSIIKMDDKQLEFYKDIIRHPKKYSNYYILPISGNVNIVSYEVYNQYVYAITDSKVIITFPDEKTLEQYGSCSDCFTKISSREFP